MAHLGSYLWFSEAIDQVVSSISFETIDSFDRMRHAFLHQNLSIKKLTVSTRRKSWSGTKTGGTYFSRLDLIPPEYSWGP